MFPDDANLFFLHSDVNVLFEKIDKELANVSVRFNANKLSLNFKKDQILFLPQIIKKRYYCAVASKSEYKWVDC